MAYRQHLDNNAVYHGQLNPVEAQELTEHFMDHERHEPSMNERMREARSENQTTLVDIVESDGTRIEMKTRTNLSA